MKLLYYYPDSSDSTFIILLHCIYGFTFTYLDIQPPRNHRLAAGFHAVLLVTLWTTKLVITDDFVYRDFMLLAAPYIEPKLGILGPFFLLYSAGGATLSLAYWVKPENRKKNGANVFIIGFLL